MYDTCFEDNQFLGSGAVLTTGHPPVDLSNNYGTDSGVNLTSICQFLVELEDDGEQGQPQLDSGACTQFDAAQCGAAGPPTRAPSMMPSGTPSSSPVAPPSYWESFGSRTESPTASTGTRTGISFVFLFVVSNAAAIVMLVM